MAQEESDRRTGREDQHSLDLTSPTHPLTSLQEPLPSSYRKSWSLANISSKYLGAGGALLYKHPCLCGRRLFKTLTVSLFPLGVPPFSPCSPPPLEPRGPVCPWHQAADVEGRERESCLSNLRCPTHYPILGKGQKEGENNFGGPENKRIQLLFPAERGQLMPGVAVWLGPTPGSRARVLCSKPDGTAGGPGVAGMGREGPAGTENKDQKVSHPFFGGGQEP